MICLLYFNGVIENWSLWNRFSITRDWTNRSFHRKQSFLRYKAYKLFLESLKRSYVFFKKKKRTFRSLIWYDFKLHDLDLDDMIDAVFGGIGSWTSYWERDLSVFPDRIPSFLKKQINLFIWRPFESNCFETLVFPGSIVDFSAKQINKSLVMSSMLGDVSLKLNKTKKPLVLGFSTEIINGLGLQTPDKLNNSYQIYSSQLKHEVNHLYDSKNIYFATSSFNRDLNQFVSSSPVHLSTDLGSTNCNMSPFPIQINQRESTIGFELAYKYKALLLIHSAEDKLNMSSLITNLTNTLKRPLIKIKMRSLINGTLNPDPYIGDLLPTSVQNVEKILVRIDLIRSLGSCLVWISDLQWQDFSNTGNRHSKKKDRIIVWSMLLNTMQDVLSKKRHLNINFVVTSTNVRSVDPSIIFSQHFNLASLHILNKSQHQTNLVHLLYAHNLHLKYKLLLNQIVSKTVGCNWIFLEGLINEISVIAKTQHKNVVDDSIVKLAFFRQSLKIQDMSIVLPSLERFTIVPPLLKRGSNSVVLSTVSNNVFWDATWCLKESTNYKIGKHIVQSLFHNLPSVFGSVFPMHAHAYLWRKNFYFLAIGYLEVPFKNSTITESIILPYILICLAGLAAQDAAIISVNNITNIIENRFVIDVEMEQDHKLALRLFASLFSELASKDTYGSQLMFHSKHCLLPKFGNRNYPCSFDLSNSKPSAPVYMQLLNVFDPANTLSSKFKPEFIFQPK